MLFLNNQCQPEDTQSLWGSSLYGLQPNNHHTAQVRFVASDLTATWQENHKDHKRIEEKNKVVATTANMNCQMTLEQFLCQQHSNLKFESIMTSACNSLVSLITIGSNSQDCQFLDPSIHILLLPLLLLLFQEVSWLCKGQKSQFANSGICPPFSPFASSFPNLLSKTKQKGAHV